MQLWMECGIIRCAVGPHSEPPVSFLVHDRLSPPPNTDWAFICFLLVTLRGDMLDSQHLKHPFPASSRSPNLPAVYSEHDWGCQDLQVAVHRVQILHPLWDLREWCECGILLGREKVVEPKGLWGRGEGRTLLGGKVRIFTWIFVPRPSRLFPHTTFMFSAYEERCWTGSALLAIVPEYQCKMDIQDFVHLRASAASGLS